MLTIDEGLILEMYADGKKSRTTVLGMMADAMKYIDDTNILNDMQSTIRKIEALSDEEYGKLDLVSAADFELPKYHNV